MTTLCRFTATPGGWACTVCGRTVQSTSTTPPAATCRPGHFASQPPADWQPVKIGDLAERALSAVGITKQLVAKTVGKCNCSERQKVLNDAGDRVQWAARRVFLGVTKRD
jgi:hypothetical protein